MQAILLTEMFTRFRGLRMEIQLSRHFEELYSRVSVLSPPLIPQSVSNYCFDSS